MPITQVQQGLDSLEYFKEKHRIGDGLMDSYLSSFYFIMATLCTVGYGDISAITPAEQSFAVVVMLLGATVFAIIVSNTSALVAGMTSQVHAQPLTPDPTPNTPKPRPQTLNSSEFF